MPETIILALLFAKLKKYKIKKIFLIWQFYIIIGFELIYLVFQINFFMHNYYLVQYVYILKAFYLSSYLFLIIRCKLYKVSLYGSACLVIGSILNNIAIWANGGKMPIFPSNSYITGYVLENHPLPALDTLHIWGSSATQLPLLTDIFDLGYAVLSIGDIFIRAFVFIIIYNTIKYLNHHEVTDKRG